MKYLVNEEDKTITIEECELTVEKLNDWLKTAVVSVPGYTVIVKPSYTKYIEYPQITYPILTPYPTNPCLPSWVVSCNNTD